MTATRRIGEWQVPEIGLGLMPLSMAGRPTRAPAIDVIRGGFESGIRLFDTADVYGLGADDRGHGERLFAEALGEDADDVVLCTKGGVRREGEAWVHEGHPAYLRRACEESLSRLGRIDLYLLHAIDERVPLEESLGELDRLRQEGKIRACGVSNVTAPQLRRALRAAPIVAVQNQASPYYLDGLTDGVLTLAERQGLAFMAWGPMGSWRAGRVAHEPILCRIGENRGCSPFQVILAWLLGRSGALIPIPGASQRAKAESSAAAFGLRLERTEIEHLENAIIPRGEPTK